MFIWSFLHLRNPINLRQIKLLIIWLYPERSEDRFMVVEKSVRLYVWFRRSDWTPSSSIRMSTLFFLQTKVWLLDALSAGTITKFSWRRESSWTTSGMGGMCVKIPSGQSIRFARGLFMGWYRWTLSNFALAKVEYCLGKNRFLLKQNYFCLGIIILTYMQKSNIA